MINFLKYRLLAFIVSTSMLISAIGIGAYKYYTRGYIMSYSVDFTGGTQVLFRFSKPVASAELEKILNTHGWSGIVTREFAANNDILVRVKEASSDATGLAERIRSVLQSNLVDTEVITLQNESVGPGVGADLRWKSIRAILIALATMLLYIAFRFWSLAFAVGAVVALFHDPVAILAIFLLFDLEISINVIGAILAVIGYSVNDTIIIYSQIRSNLIKMKGSTIEEIVNTSLNQTLRRTLLTSFFTALVVGAMFVLGGAVLRDFSLALLVGIVIGTYSSIYIASAIMIELYKRKNK